MEEEDEKEEEVGRGKVVDEEGGRAFEEQRYSPGQTVSFIISTSTDA